MRQRTKKWSVLTVAVLLALSSLSLPQAVGAETVLSGKGTNTGSASVNGDNGTAVGDGATVSSIRGTAVGASSKAAWGGTALGETASASAGGVAVGQWASASGGYAIAIGGNMTEGNGAQAKGSSAVAIGNSSQATDDYAIALGSAATASHKNAVALGADSVTGEANSVSVGSSSQTRTITNVTKGDSTKDAANWDQIAKENQTLTLDVSAKGNELAANDGTVLATFTKMASVASGDYGFVSGADLWKETRANIPMTGTTYISQGNSVGANLVALDTAIAEKVATSYTGSDTIEIASDNTIKVKNMTQSTNGSLSLGDLASAPGAGATALGYVASASGKGAISIGMSSANGDLAIAAGGGARATGNYAIALGSAATASHKNAVALGADSVTGEANSVSVGSSSQTRTITNVTKGDSTKDAANWDQIAKENQTLTLDVSAKGNELAANDGTVLATFTKMASVASGDYGFVSGADLWKETRANIPMTGTTYISQGNSVGANLVALDTAIAENLINLETGITNLISYDKEKAALRIGAGIGLAANTVSFGSDIGTPRKLTDVAAGVSHTDAANVGQLIQGGAYSAVSEGIGSPQTVTLSSHDGNTKISISIAGEGTIAKGDKRLVDGDTVYTYVDSVTSNLSTDVSGIKTDVSQLKTDVSDIQADMTAESGSYVDAGTKVGKNLEALDDAIGEITKKGNVIDVSLDADGNLKTSVADNLKKIDDKIGTLDSSKDRRSRGTLYNVIRSENTISDNLAALDEALGGSAWDVSHLQDVTKAPNATADGTNAIALGEGSQAGGSDSISLGTHAAASKVNALAFGNSAVASAENAVAFGNSANASAENAMAFGNGASASGGGSIAIGSGSVATEDQVVSFGAAGSERRLMHVAAGMNDTDAVNVAQMNSVVQMNFERLHHSLSHEINKAAAGSAALAALHPEDYDPDDKLSFAVGFGHYKSANAGAIGAFYKPNYNTTFSIGATLGNGESMMNMGVSFKLGSGAKNGAKYRTGEAVAAELASLRKSNDRLLADNQTLKEDNAAQAKEIAALKADNERMKEQIALILSKMELSDHVERTMVK